ncbi:hypothetical protein AS361_05380 [Myroides marinus]|nr:hypothetical protein AS361_05380 [Myroides marinus]
MKGIITRYSLAFLFIIIYQLRNNLVYYDILLVAIILLNLLLSKPTIKTNKSKYYSLMNTISWFPIILTTFIIKDVLLSWILIVLILLRILLFTINYLKFNNFYLPQTILNYSWTICMILYLAELLLNSTHGLANIFLLGGVISTLELTFIVLLQKHWNKNVRSIFRL